MFTIENDHISITVDSKGAELQRLYSRTTDTEYLWNGDPAFWSKRSPVLFPIVGTLKNNTYFVDGKAYTLPRHGFARDMQFTLSRQSTTSLTFSLEASEQTLKSYPFPFRLELRYHIVAETLVVEYQVFNPGAKNMFFSIGGHPAFRLPLDTGLAYEDYYIEFEREENALRWMISSEGLIEPVAVPFIQHSTTLPITRELFSKDALVFKHLNSSSLRVKSDRSPRGLEFNFAGFPYLGLWAAKNADFLCIEPWCGIADSTTADQQFATKEGVQWLTPGETFRRQWSVRVY